MIDLHTHILPGIDDGAPDLETAVAMCRLAREQGCHTLVATPHHRHPGFPTTPREDARALLGELQTAVGSGFQLLLGAEVHVDAQLVEDVLSGAIPPPTLGNSRAVLLEFADEPSPHDPASVVHELVVAGYRPILAHPEVIRWLVKDLELMRRLVKLGALVQITADGLLGRYGLRTRSFARQLVELGLAHVVASDCHDLERRAPCLDAAHAELSRRWSPELAKRMLSSNPWAILGNRPLSRAA